MRRYFHAKLKLFIYFCILLKLRLLFRPNKLENSRNIVNTEKFVLEYFKRTFLKSRDCVSTHLLDFGSTDGILFYSCACWIKINDLDKKTWKNRNLIHGSTV